MLQAGSRELIESNRVVLARQGGWPDGAVDKCRALEARYPGWLVWWQGEKSLSVPQAGYAARVAQAAHGQPTLSAATAEELAKLIEAAHTYYPREPRTLTTRRAGPVTPT